MKRQLLDKWPVIPRPCSRSSEPDRAMHAVQLESLVVKEPNCYYNQETMTIIRFDLLDDRHAQLP